MGKFTAGCVLLCWLALGPPCPGQSVKLPDRVEVATGRLASLAVEWDGDDLRYLPDPALDCFREYDPDPHKVRLRLVGYAPGTYTLAAIACKGGKLSEFSTCKVVVGGAPGPSPGPAPGPTPTPEDALGKALAAAYALEADPDRAAHVARYAALWRQGATIDLSRVATAGDLYGVLRRVSLELLPADALPGLRGVAGSALSAALPTDPAVVLTAEHKAAFRALAARLATLLEGLK